VCLTWFGNLCLAVLLCVCTYMCCFCNCVFCCWVTGALDGFSLTSGSLIFTSKLVLFGCDTGGNFLVKLGLHLLGELGGLAGNLWMLVCGLGAGATGELLYWCWGWGDCVWYWLLGFNCTWAVEHWHTGLAAVWFFWVWALTV